MPIDQETAKGHTRNAAYAGLTLGSVIVALMTLDSAGVAPWMSRAQGEELSERVIILEQRASINDEKLDILVKKGDLVEGRLDDLSDKTARNTAILEGLPSKLDEIIANQERAAEGR